MRNFDRNKMLAQMAMLEKGVIPMPGASLFFSPVSGEIMLQIRNQLSTLPEDERRIVKRKFRKMHRRVAKEMIRASNRRGLHSAKSRVDSMNKFKTTDNTRRPTSRAHEMRNREVWMHMMRLSLEGKI